MGIYSPDILNLLDNFFTFMSGFFFRLLFKGGFESIGEILGLDQGTMTMPMSTKSTMTIGDDTPTGARSTDMVDDAHTSKMENPSNNNSSNPTGTSVGGTNPTDTSVGGTKTVRNSPCNNPSIPVDPLPS